MESPPGAPGPFLCVVFLASFLCKPSCSGAKKEPESSMTFMREVVCFLNASQTSM